MWKFSNFQPCKIQIDNIIYPTLEHAYQAMKTFNNRDRQRIANMPTPGQAKRLGRTLKNIRYDWDKIKVDIMYHLLEDKFSREPFKSLLLTEKGAIIEVTTWHDTFWGICTCKEHDASGQNWLGSLLERVRSKLIEGESHVHRI